MKQMTKAPGDNMKIGDRVGTIVGQNPMDKSYTSFGFGVYEGDFLPTEAKGPIATIMLISNTPCARILLDNGKRVYACECIVDDEDVIQNFIKDNKITVLDVDETRTTFEIMEAEEESKTAVLH